MTMYYVSLEALSGYVSEPRCMGTFVFQTPDWTPKLTTGQIGVSVYINLRNRLLRPKRLV